MDGWMDGWMSLGYLKSGDQQSSYSISRGWMDMCTNCPDNPSSSCFDICVRLKWLATDIAVLGAASTSVFNVDALVSPCSEVSHSHLNRFVSDLSDLTHSGTEAENYVKTIMTSIVILTTISLRASV